MNYKSRELNFAFRKFEINTKYNTYLNESSFKHYMMGGLRPYLLCLFRGGQNFRKPAYIILECSLINFTISQYFPSVDLKKQTNTDAVKQSRTSEDV